MTEKQVNATDALAEIENLLKGSIVSTDGSDAKENLLQTAHAFTQQVWVKTTTETQAILSEFHGQSVHIDSKDPAHEEIATAYFDLSWPKPEDSNQVLGLSFVGRHHSTVIHQHQLRAPKRESEIEHYIQSYFAWQLNQFMQRIK